MILAAIALAVVVAAWAALLVAVALVDPPSGSETYDSFAAEDRSPWEGESH